VVKFTQDQKKDAVIELCTREGSAAAVADRLGTCRYSLYKWKKELLGEEDTNMSEPGKPMLPDDRDALLAEVDSLKKQIYRQQMELDILNKAVEIIKKDQGIDPRKLTNKEKVSLIDALRERYPLNELLKMMGIPKSSYFYQKKAQTRPDKYAALRTNVKKIFTENQSRYGYRRVYAIIRNNGTIISEKVIRRIMKEEQLIVPFKRKRRYSSYKGEISPAVENLVDRDFHANTPNTKWLTDLTEFHIPAGKVYLSPIIDCFDGLVVSWTIGTSPDAELVNTMLDDAICNLTDGEHPIIHSDRGCHYRWPGWVSRMENAGLTRSMSKKGCSPDNSACEGFFGRLKNEMFYYRSWKDVSVNQFIDKLDNYLRWYNEKRIKMSLGAMSPVDYRRSIGLAV
jgi:transposase InsO family protein/transposase-like protein